MARISPMFIEGRNIKNFADIERSFMFEVEIMNFTNKQLPGYDMALGTNWKSEDITFRARNATIPQRGHEAIESNFGAMKQYFPGKPSFGNTTSIQFEETESQGIGIWLYNWHQMIFDVTKGHSNSGKKRGQTKSDAYVDMIRVTPVRYNGEVFNNSIYFYNAWLQNVDDVALDYSTNEAVKYNATFQFDFWLMGDTDNPPYLGGPNPTLKLNVQETAS